MTKPGWALPTLIFIAYFFNVSLALSKEPQVRVRVASKLGFVEISGTDMVKKIGASEQSKVYKGRRSLSFNCAPLLKRAKIDAPLLLARIESGTGLLSQGENKYRGSLLLVASKGSEGGCDVVNSLSLETYISSVLSKEMSPSWPIEALKAQAVAARSYAHHKIMSRQVSRFKGYETYYDLENSEKHQVNGDFFDVTASTSKAQRLTRGEVLADPAGEPVPVFFHSKCGGQTRSPEEVWSNSVPGYQSVACPYCHGHGVKDWKTTMPLTQFHSAVDKALGMFEGSKLSQPASVFKVAPNGNADPFLRVYDDDKLIALKKSRLRSTLGRKRAKSNYFSIRASEGKVVLEGKGFGHGVGLCQFGALEMAKRGYNYQEILAHYFPKMKLMKIY